MSTPTTTNGGSFILPKQRRSLLRPPMLLEEITLAAVRAWEKVPSKVRLNGATPQSLAAMVAQVRDLKSKERDELLALTAIEDARRVAADKTYRKLLDLSAVSQREAHSDPEVAAVFAPTRGDSHL